jgi:HEAT repeat protein
LAQAVVEAGAVEALVDCLSQFDTGVKESAAWALGNIAKHNAELAQNVVDQDAVPVLLLCIREPENSLKKVATSALGHICSHSSELAQSVVDAEGILDIVSLLNIPQVKRQACACLSHIAKHSVELAELVVEGEIVPRIFNLLREDDTVVRKNTATCIKEISKHTPELAAMIVNAGGLPAIVDYIKESDDEGKIPAIMTLGFIAAFADTLATNVIKAKAIAPLCFALSSSTSDQVKATATWALGQIGKHSSEHSRAVAEASVFPRLIEAFLSPKSTPELKAKAKKALKQIISKSTFLDALCPLLQPKTPEGILLYVLKQLSQILPNDVDARKKFAESSSLTKLLAIKTDDDEMIESIKIISACYPDDVIKYYTPGYDVELLKKIDSIM